MNVAYLNLIADAGAAAISFIGLVDAAGDELSGGAPAYARQPVVFTAAVNGLIRPTLDLTFNVPPSTIVGGWRGYDADTLGTDYGGADLSQESFTGQGEYILLAAGTGISHSVA